MIVLNNNMQKGSANNSAGVKQVGVVTYDDGSNKTIQEQRGEMNGSSYEMQTGLADETIAESNQNGIVNHNCCKRLR